MPELIGKKVLYMKEEYECLAVRQVPPLYVGGKENYFVADIKKGELTNTVNTSILSLIEEEKEKLIE